MSCDDLLRCCDLSFPPWFFIPAVTAGRSAMRGSDRTHISIEIHILKSSTEYGYVAYFLITYSHNMYVENPYYEFGQTGAVIFNHDP